VQGWYVLSAGCAGQEVRVADVDLDDASPPRVRYFEGGGPEKSRLTALTVTRTDLELVHAAGRPALRREPAWDDGIAVC